MKVYALIMLEPWEPTAYYEYFDKIPTVDMVKEAIGISTEVATKIVTMGEYSPGYHTYRLEEIEVVEVPQ